MKKITCFIVLALITSGTFGQIKKSPTSVKDISVSESTNKQIVPPVAAYDASANYVLNVFFTLINTDSGQNNLGTALDTPAEVENKFLECVKLLNIAYNPSKIYFKYTGYKIVKSTAITQMGFSNSDPDWNAISQYREAETMNLYFVNSTGSGTTHSKMGFPDSVYPIGILNFPSYLGYHLGHEVGHCLSLYNTEEAVSHFPPTHPLYASTQCERVTRNTSDPLYNANIAGDEIHDTPAQPFVYDSNFQSNCGAYIPNPDFKNCYNEPYINALNSNYMSFSHVIYSACPMSFTPGQTLRMRKFIQYNTTIPFNPNYPAYLGEINNCRNTIASMYQPFYQDIVPGGIYSTEPLPGGLLVCRYQLIKYRFQTGLNWEFTNAPSGTILQNPVQQFNYTGSLNQPVGVKIPALGNAIINTPPINTLTPYLCGFEPYSNGRIASTPVMGSMNIKTRELTAEELQNPLLFDQLEKKQYHIVKLQTASGAEIQKVIYNK